MPAAKKMPAAKHKAAAKTKAEKIKKAVQPATPERPKAQPKKVGGRPTLYSEALAAGICERLASGESLLTICKDDGMPSRSAVMRWLLDDKHPGFRDKYAQARDEQADFYAEQIVAISDEECTMVKHGDGDEMAQVEVVFDATAVARNRLRVDARKWYASKLAPKKYGDRTTLAGDQENPIAVLTMEQIAANPKSRLSIK